LSKCLDLSIAYLDTTSWDIGIVLSHPGALQHCISIASNGQGESAFVVKNSGLMPLVISGQRGFDAWTIEECGRRVRLCAVSRRMSLDHTITVMIVPKLIKEGSFCQLPALVCGDSPEYIPMGIPSAAFSFLLAVRFFTFVPSHPLV
jgi:hypothetical protein